MKHQKTIALLALTATLAAACPPQVAMAQAVASVRLAATRGQVEFLNGNGRWEKLRGPMTAAVGTAVRTGPGAEVEATFADGSSVTLGETSAMRFSKIGQTGDARIKMLGQMAASISPQHVANNTLEFDTPVGRATINKAFAVARAVRGDVASSVATLKLQTPTARAVRVAVTQGAATLQALYNMTGVVTSTDPDHDSFMVTDNQTGRARRIVVGAVTLLARHDPQTAHSVRSPKTIVEALSSRQSVVVYGEPVNVEGPGDLVAAADTGSVNAAVVFPEGSDYLAAEDFIQTPDLPVVGDGVTATAGNSALLDAGSSLPTLAAGTVLSEVVANQVGFGSVLSGGGSWTLVGVGVATAIGIAVIASNTGHTGNEQTFIPSTGNLSVTVNRSLASPMARRAAMSVSTPSAGFADILAGPSSVRGGTAGATLFVGSDGYANPTLMGRLPLSRKVQLHLGATFSSAMDSNMTQVDMGVDYLFNSTHAIGAALRTATFNVMDSNGSNSYSSTSTPEVRYTVKF